MRKTMRLLQMTAAAAVLVVTATAFAVDKPFDPTRDSTKDLIATVRQAQKEHKNIILDVGGNWCPWCILLERTLATDPELHALIEKNYLVLHVNFSKENENKTFLAGYPGAPGYPAWYVLSPDGMLLKSEDTSELEQTHNLNEGYNRDSLKAFLTKYAPRP